MSDLERAYNALSAKTAAYNTLWQYADGDHPLTYTNERLREIFRQLDAKFTANWCSVVLNACLERIELGGWQVADDETAQMALQTLWETYDLGAQADDVHEAALVCGEAFVIVWPDADGLPQAYYNDPRMAHMFYDSESPSRKSFGAKWWDDADGHRRLTLYYPDRLEYYVSRGKAESAGSAAAFMVDLVPTAPNPFGEIPVFHFRTSIRKIKSDLTDVIPLQNGINKLLADMMVAAEYGAYKQRYIISNADTPGKLKNAPNEIWDLPAGDGVGQQTQVGEFSATDLRNYLDAIDRLALSVAIITRTPKHYFLAQGGDPSGEALIAMEAPLNKKAARRIRRFITTWRQVGAFMLQVSGLAAVPVTAITPLFAEPETVQPVTQAEIRTAEVGAGIPLTTALRREGWTQAELDEMAADKEAEQAGTAQLQEVMLEEARRKFDQGPRIRDQEPENGVANNGL